MTKHDPLHAAQLQAKSQQSRQRSDMIRALAQEAMKKAARLREEAERLQAENAFSDEELQKYRRRA